jgi:hypothetical protein
LLYARAHVGEGRCGEGTDPLRRVTEDAGCIGGWREETPSLKKFFIINVIYE